MARPQAGHHRFWPRSTGGHRIGNAVLVEVARRIKAALRGDALLGRLGGDKVAVVLSDCDCDAAGARVVAERARSRVRGDDFAGSRW